MIELLVPVWHAGAVAASEPAVVEPASPIAELAGPVVETAPGVAPALPVRTEIPWRGIVTGAWLAGIAAFLVRVTVGARRARGIAPRGEPVRGLGVADAWRTVDGRGDAPRIVASEEIEAPIVVGAFAPVVVVPRAAKAWSAERWRVVLLHELAHVSRRDGLANLVAQLACCLHWIDPLVWIAARRMREERELATDDAVLRSGARPSTYAEHLVELATAALHAPASALAMAAPSRFEARVVALLDPRRSRSSVGPRRTRRGHPRRRQDGTVKSESGHGHYASFVGIVPADAPRFVVLVGIDGVEGHGGKVAAPVFAKIATRALAH